VVGQCLEQAGAYEQALTEYRSYLARYGDRNGAAAVRARELLARRSRAGERARTALAQEAELAGAAADPQVVAVLPVEVVSPDTTYQPLSRGLAQILTSDLALLQRFRMVERLQVGALFDELALAQTARVDQSTAARVGRLLQAGRMVQGLAAIPPEGETRLEAAVVLSTGEITSPESFTGRLRDLLQLEKQLVISIASRLGYVLSAAERQLILENGTQNLAAFLAYSRGLLAEDRGDYRAAAAFYAEAVGADPSFDAARDGYDATTLAPVVDQAAATAITVTAFQPAPRPAPVFAPAVSQALGASEIDVAATQAEQIQVVDQTQTTTRATNTTISRPSGTIENRGETPVRTGVIRIRIRLP
jgi:tetratricopeptide (TPR) repeat protein